MPNQTWLSGTSLRTCEQAPISAFSPMVTEGMITTLAPKRDLRLRRPTLFSLFFVRSGVSVTTNAYFITTSSSTTVPADSVPRLPISTRSPRSHLSRISQNDVNEQSSPMRTSRPIFV